MCAELTAESKTLAYQSSSEVPVSGENTGPTPPGTGTVRAGAGSAACAARSSADGIPAWSRSHSAANRAATARSRTTCPTLECP